MARKKFVNKKNKNLGNFIRRQIFLSIDFVRNSKYYFYFVFALFFFSGLLGYFYVPSGVEEIFLNLLREIIGKSKGMNALQLFWFIFTNNLNSSFLGMILGVIFGLFSFFTVFLNGYLVGFVSEMVVRESGSFSSLFLLVPHGIFELPAVFISLAFGLRLGRNFFIVLINSFDKNSMNNLSEDFISSIRSFVMVVIPLLLIAAFIEAILIAGVK